MNDLEGPKELADNAMRRCDSDDDWYSTDDVDVIPDSEDMPYIAAANPEAVLNLIARVRELEREVAEKERLHERTLEERDRAQDALQNTHIALGGDGEWVGKSVCIEPPDSGDLHEDVPALAAEVFARVRELEANQRTPGTVEVCVRAMPNHPEYDGKCINAGMCGWECKAEGCPIKRSVSPSP